MPASRTRRIRFSGRHNDAYYAYFPNLAQPVENGISGRGSVSRCQRREPAGLVQSTRSTCGVDYRAPFSETLEWQRDGGTPPGRTSSTATSHCPAIAWIPDRAIVDFSHRLGHAQRSFDASLLLRTHSTTTPTSRRRGTATARRSRAGGAWCSAANCDCVGGPGALSPRRPGLSGPEPSVESRWKTLSPHASRLRLSAMRP